MATPVVEPVPVSDVYVSELVRIEELSGGNMRFTFAADQDDIVDPLHHKTKVVKLRIIMHADNVAATAKAAYLAAAGLSGVIGSTIVTRRH